MGIAGSLITNINDNVGKATRTIVKCCRIKKDTMKGTIAFGIANRVL